MKFITVSIAVILLSSLVLGQTTDAFVDSNSGPLLKLVSSARQNDGSYNGELSSTFDAVAIQTLLGSSVEESSKVCDFINAQNPSTVAELYYGVAAAAELGCQQELSAAGVTLLETAVNEATSIDDMYYAAEVIGILAPKAKLGAFDAASASTLVGKILALFNDEDGTFRKTEDDEESSPLNAGYALNALASLKQSMSNELDEADLEQIVNVADKIEALFETAEGEDSLQFSDPVNTLKATSLIISGTVRLSKALEQPLQVTQEQMTKFAEYLVESKHVGSLENGHYLLVGLTTCADNHLHVPLVVVMTQGSVLSSSSKGDAGFIKVKVTNVMGKPVTGGAKVFLNRAFPSDNEDQEIISNQELQAGSDGTLQFNFVGAKPQAGYYTVDFRVSPNSDDSRFSEVESTQRIVKIVTGATVHSFETVVSTSANEQEGSDRRMYSASYPKPIGDKLQVNEDSFMHFNFRIKNTVTNKMMDSIHQAFLKFTNKETGQDVFFHCRLQGRKFKRTISIRDEAESLVAGEYAVELLIGDMFLSNSIAWKAADVSVQTEVIEKDENVGEDAVVYEPKPTITHVFRQPDSRPPAIVSLVFTALVLTPLLVLIVRLGQIGANASGIPKGMDGMYALGFVGSLAAIMGLFAVYWLMLDMFTTLYLLSALGLVSFLLGWKALGALANAREAAEKKSM